MALSIPRYIDAADVQDVTIRYLWDDWNVEQAEEPIDEEFHKRLTGISQRAIIAFTIGTAEWIVYRFSALCDDSLPSQYVEAAWAQIVHWLYEGSSWEDQAVTADWIGPVKGPLGIAMTRVMYAIQSARDDEDPELRAAWIANLAPYVMSNPAPYQEWRELVMKRFTVLYPRNPDETLGEVVPRAALDPNSGFQPEQTEDLINDSLATLDYKTNPFLNSPKRMLEEGFDGIPYKFDIEKDRKARYEW